MTGNEAGGIFVTPEYQNRAVLDHVGASRSYLELAVSKANTTARRFYESYGFRLVNEQVSDTTSLPDRAPTITHM
jgi:ribosomal protein S18 acetylase RimI-like enzyme